MGIHGHIRPLALGAVLAIAACGTAGDNQTAFFKAEAGYTALLQAAADYTGLPRCIDGGPKLCSDQAIVVQIRKASNAADATIQSAEDTVRQHPEIDASFAVSAAQDAVKALSLVLTTYHIGGL